MFRPTGSRSTHTTFRLNRSWRRAIAAATTTVVTMIAFVALPMTSVAASACDNPDRTWDGGAGTMLWTTPANWNADTLPAASEDVCIPEGMGIVNVNAAVTVDSVESLSPVQITIGNSLLLTGLQSSFTSLQITNATLDAGPTVEVHVTDLFTWDGGTISGSGTFTIEGAATGAFGTNGIKALTGVVFTNAGSIDWTDGNITLAAVATFVNSGTLNLQGNDSMSAASGGTFINAGDLNKNVALTTTIDTPTTNTGNINISAGTIVVDDTFTSSNSVVVSSVASMTVSSPNSFTQTSGTSIIHGTLESDSISIAAGATFMGAGTVVGDVTNAGTVHVSLDNNSGVGDFDITGNYTQTATGTLGIDWNDNDGVAGTDYDVLEVSGAATWDGTLSVRTPGVVDFVSGNTFTPLVRGSGGGAFDLITDDVFSSYLNPSYGGGTVTLTVAAATGSISGTIYNDLNNNGTVDAGDPGAASINLYIDTTDNDSYDVGEPTTTTALGGTYTIGSVPDGTYDLGIVPPANGSVTSDLNDAIVVDGAEAGANGSVNHSGSISGTVSNDVDNDNIVDTGEGVGGLAVGIDRNGDAASESVTTDSSGAYTLLSVPNGTFTVTPAAPSGAVVSPASGNKTITAGSDETDLAFEVVYGGSISGTIYNDMNNNGAVDGGEPRAVDATVYLDTTSNDTLDVGERTAVTDSNGNYALVSVPAATYDVGVTAINATGSVDPADAVVVTTTAVTAVNGGVNYAGSISGTISNDVDNDNIIDAGEAVAGVTVAVDRDGNSTNETVTTDSNGVFTLLSVPNGTFTVTPTAPSGAAVSPTTANDTVTAGSDETGLDFEVAFGGSISGTIINDVNNNGMADPSEPGAAGIAVYVDMNTDDTLDPGEPSSVTAANGSYTIASVSAGQYDVAVAGAAHIASVPIDPSDAVTVGLIAVTGINGAIVYSGSVSGTIVNDLNNNGVADVGEPAAMGATVYLDTAANDTFDVGERLVLTDAGGNYTMPSVAPASYDVGVAATNATGSIDPSDSVNVTTAAVTAVDGGVHYAGSISGAVYNDENDNGAADANEGVANIIVDLDRGGSTESVTSDGNGVFTFLSVPNGTFTITTNVVDATVSPGTNSATVMSGSDEINENFEVGYTSALSIGDIDIVEGSGGTKNAILTIALSQASSESITVWAQTTDAGATASSDYTAIMHLVTFVPGDVARTVHVPLMSDSNDETNEAFAVNLSNAARAEINDETASVMIIDDDGPTLSISGSAVWEDVNSPGNVLVYTVTPSAASVQNLSVAAAVTGGTARVDHDFTASDATLNIPAGSSQPVTFSVTIVSDSFEEDDETVVVSLSGPVNATVLTGSALGTIVDDDDAALADTHPDSAQKTVSTGQRVETNDPPTDADPIQVGVVTGSPGLVTIVEEDVPTQTAPSGYTLLPLEVLIDAPPASPGSPHELTFKVTASVLEWTGVSAKDALERLAILQNGDVVGECTTVITAVPDPCIESVNFDGSVAQIIVRTSVSAAYIAPSDFAERAAETGVWSFALLIEHTDAQAPASGYHLVGRDGGVFAYGDARFLGSMGGKSLNAPIVGMVSLPDGSGYYLVASDGGVFAYGDASFHGSMGGKPLNSPIVGIALVSGNDGYYLVASDGGVFSFGETAFHGSMGGRPLNAPIVGMASLPGKGYYLLANDGGVFAFGSVVFRGSMGGKVINAAIMGITASYGGMGYVLAGEDGGVYAFGQAAFHGSIGGTRLVAPIVGIAAYGDGSGYVLAGADGGVYAYGQVAFVGSMGGKVLNSPIVGIALR